MPESFNGPKTKV